MGRFFLYVALAGITVFGIQQENLNGFLTISLTLGSIVGGIAGLVVSSETDSDFAGIATWLATTLLFPIAIIVLIIAAIIWIANQSDNSNSRTYRKTGQIDIYEEEE